MKVRIDKWLDLTPSKAEQLNRLQQVAYSVEAELIDFWEIPNLRESSVQLAESGLTFLVAVESEEPIGFIGYRRELETVDIDRVAVAPGKFRHGIGRRLMRRLHSLENDAATFGVTTPINNTPAMNFYASLGYHEVKRTSPAKGLVVAVLVREATRVP